MAARWFTAKTSEFDYAQAAPGAGSAGSVRDAAVRAMPRLPRRGPTTARGASARRPGGAGDRSAGGQGSSARLGCRVVRDGRDVVEAVRLPQGEQALGFGGEGVYPGRGLRLAAEDAVVVAAGPDL